MNEQGRINLKTRKNLILQIQLAVFTTGVSSKKTEDTALKNVGIVINIIC